MRISVLTALLLLAACTQASAQNFDDPDTLKSLPEDLARELRTVTKSGCRESMADPSVPELIRNCTRVLERKKLTDRQRSFAYYVRGSLKGFSPDPTESQADFERSIAINPFFGPAYDKRGGGANAARESAVRDYQKAIELGYRDGFGPLIMAQWRLECPTLAYKGNECLPDGGTRADRYECESSVQLPTMCVWKQKGPPKGLVDCEPGFGPGPGCTLAAATAAPVATEPPQQMAPTAEAPQVPQVPNAPAAEEKPGWFGWLWGSKKPAVEPPPPQPSVTAASPTTAPAPSPPPVEAAQTGNVGCDFQKTFGFWRLLKTTDKHGVHIKGGGNVENFYNVGKGWESSKAHLRLVPMEGGGWRSFLLFYAMENGAVVTSLRPPSGVTIKKAGGRIDEADTVEAVAAATQEGLAFHVTGLLKSDLSRLLREDKITLVLIKPGEKMFKNIGELEVESAGLREAMAAAEKCRSR